MIDRTSPADWGAADHLGPSPSPSRRRLRATIGDVVPIGPNAFAAGVSFLVLLMVAWFCAHALQWVWEGAFDDELIATYLIPGGLVEIVGHAAVGALLFLVIGAVLQTWYHHRPFPPELPGLLAFPIAWALIVPEMLVRGGSLVSVAVVGSLIGLAFSVHWGMLRPLSDMMD